MDTHLLLVNHHINHLGVLPPYHHCLFIHLFLWQQALLVHRAFQVKLLIQVQLVQQVGLVLLGPLGQLV